MEVYFLLKCSRCKWWRKTRGISEDLKDLVEFKPCQNCHGKRKYKCPKCATICPLERYNVPDAVVQLTVEEPKLGPIPTPPVPEKKKRGRKPKKNDDI